MIIVNPVMGIKALSSFNCHPEKQQMRCSTIIDAKYTE